MRANSFWLLFILLTFIITLPISWLGLAKADFFYPIIYDSIDIDAHIQRYAPRNQFNKMGFESTSKQERIDLFHGVVTAIHDKGNGLESLTYMARSPGVSKDSRSNQEQVILFTDAEVTHLKDVANLLEKVKPWILVALELWFLCVVWIIWKRMKLPSSPRLFLLSLIWLVIALLVLLSGPEHIFNQLHVWAFPEENQWFFFYEDSLMSTMMKAPLLFGVISAIWCAISILLTVILFRLMRPVLLLRRKGVYE